jgi:hypothetical protein
VNRAITGGTSEFNVHLNALKLNHAKKSASTSKQGVTDVPSPPHKFVKTTPKKVVEVSPANIFNRVSSSVYLENHADIDAFVTALKDSLEEAIAHNKRVRIR